MLLKSWLHHKYIEHKCSSWLIGEFTVRERLSALALTACKTPRSFPSPEPGGYSDKHHWEAAQRLELGLREACRLYHDPLQTKSVALWSTAQRTVGYVTSRRSREVNPFHAAAHGLLLEWWWSELHWRLRTLDLLSMSKGYSLTPCVRFLHVYTLKERRVGLSSVCVCWLNSCRHVPIIVYITSQKCYEVLQPHTWFMITQTATIISSQCQ